MRLTTTGFVGDEQGDLKHHGGTEKAVCCYPAEHYDQWRAEGLDLENMIVEDSYDGLRLEEKMTQEFIDDMIDRFKNGKKLHKKYVFQIILAVKDIVYNEPTMVETHISPNHKLTVCGDTPGQYFDLLEIFRLNGFPSETHAYLFNARGDLRTDHLVTLGSAAAGTLTVVLALRALLRRRDRRR